MLRVWYTGDTLLTLAEAQSFLSDAKRCGFTTWVTDEAGNHVAVKGAMRPNPSRFST